MARRVSTKTGASAPSKGFKAATGKGRGGAAAGPGSRKPEQKPQVVAFNESTVDAINRSGPPGHEVAHINPREGRLLKALGGSGEKDPETNIKSYEVVGDKKGKDLPKVAKKYDLKGLPQKGEGRVDDTHRVILATDKETKALNALKTFDKERGYDGGSGPEITRLAEMDFAPLEHVRYRGEVIPNLNSLDTDDEGTVSSSSDGNYSNEGEKNDSGDYNTSDTMTNFWDTPAGKAEQKRIDDANEKKRLEDIAEAKRISDEEVAADKELKRLEKIVQDEKISDEAREHAIRKKKRAEKKAAKLAKEQAEAQAEIEAQAEEAEIMSTIEQDADISAEDALDLEGTNQDTGTEYDFDFEAGDKIGGPVVGMDGYVWQQPSSYGGASATDSYPVKEEEYLGPTIDDIDMSVTLDPDEPREPDESEPLVSDFEYLANPGSKSSGNPNQDAADEEDDSEDDGDLYEDLDGMLEEPTQTNDLDDGGDNEESDGGGLNDGTDSSDNDPGVGTTDDGGGGDDYFDLDDGDELNAGGTTDDGGGGDDYFDFDDPTYDETDDYLNDDDDDDQPDITPDDDDNDVNEDEPEVEDEPFVSTGDADKDKLLKDLKEKYEKYGETDYEKLYHDEFSDDLKEDYGAATKGLDYNFLTSGNRSEFNTAGNTVNDQQNYLGELLEGDQQDDLMEQAEHYASNPKAAIREWYKQQKKAIEDGTTDSIEELDLSEWADPSENYNPEFFGDESAEGEVLYDKRYYDPDKTYYDSELDDPTLAENEQIKGDAFGGLMEDDSTFDMGDPNAWMNVSDSEDDQGLTGTEEGLEDLHGEVVDGTFVPEILEDEGNDQMGGTDDLGFGDDGLGDVESGGGDFPPGYIDPDTLDAPATSNLSSGVTDTLETEPTGFEGLDDSAFDMGDPNAFMDVPDADDTEPIEEETNFIEGSEDDGGIYSLQNPDGTIDNSGLSDDAKYDLTDAVNENAGLTSKDAGYLFMGDTFFDENGIVPGQDAFGGYYDTNTFDSSDPNAWMDAPEDETPDTRVSTKRKSKKVSPKEWQNPGSTSGLSRAQSYETWKKSGSRSGMDRWGRLHSG